MISSTFKKFNQFVNEELNKFYDDFEENSKNYKVPINFAKSKSYDYNNKNSMLVNIKKKEVKIKKKKIWNRNNNTNKRLF